MDPFTEDFIIQQRPLKQAFLKQEIIEKGYDGSQFADFLNSVKPEGGSNIDIWSLEELKEIVYKFKSLALQQPDPVIEFNSVSNTINSPIPQFDNPFDEVHSMVFTEPEPAVMKEAKVPSEKEIKDLGVKKTVEPEPQFSASQQIQQVSATQQVNTFPKQSAPSQSKTQEETKFGTASVVQETEDKRSRTTTLDVKIEQEAREETFSSTLTVKASEPTHLTNAKHSEVIVHGYDQVKTGLFSTTHIEYLIRTMPYGWDVRRRFSDFVWLRNTLLKLHPGVMIPPIPKKNKNYKPGFLRRRVYFFQRFLNACMLNDEIRADKNFFVFLNANSEAPFKAQKKEADKKPRIAKVRDITTVSGSYNFKKAPLEINKEIKFHTAAVGELFASIDPIYDKIKKVTRQLISDFEQVSNTLFTLADCYATLHTAATTFNKRTEIGKSLNLENIYLTINNMMATWAEYTFNQSENLQKNIIHFYKYAEYENDVFKEVLDFRTKVGVEYVNKKKEIMAKKEKLFNQKDISKWDINPQVLKGINKDDILKDKKLAFELMLSKETAALTEVRTTFAYYNAMCFNDVDNALQERCRQYAKNFFEFGKAQTEIMSQIQTRWFDALGHISQSDVPLTTMGYEIKTKASIMKNKMEESKMEYDDDCQM